ncbi:MAG: SLBB domain-containing protein, partial [Bacteroidetes bacterium]|nr:SLBB domain-containing protein [Bacteroidota bacterium]
MKKILVAVFVCFASLLFAQNDSQQLSKQNNLSMFQPITVTIGGDFIVTGSFTAYKSERLDHFVTKVFTEAESNMRSGLNQIDMIKKVTAQIEKYAKRDITLKHRNGETVKIDLLKFHLTGDMSNNPYLMDDDVIIFPSYDDERSVVEISGAVNKPTKFQFVDGDKLSDAILFAGGINPAYDNVTTAEISRLSNDGNKENVINVPIKDDYKLQIGDRIRILFSDNDKKSYKTLVLGEVRTPGYVYITKDNTTIKDVIAKAGGFTDKAWLERS